MKQFMQLQQKKKKRASNGNRLDYELKITITWWLTTRSQANDLIVLIETDNRLQFFLLWICIFNNIVQSQPRSQGLLLFPRRVAGRGGDPWERGWFKAISVTLHRRGLCRRPFWWHYTARFPLHSRSNGRNVRWCTGSIQPLVQIDNYPFHSWQTYQV